MKQLIAMWAGATVFATVAAGGYLTTVQKTVGMDFLIAVGLYMGTFLGVFALCDYRVRHRRRGLPL